MNNKNIEITVSKDRNSIKVEAKIPKMNPRKDIHYIRYDVTDAHRAAVSKYGELVGNLRSNEPEHNPVLDNKNRPVGNVLIGTWVFNTTTKAPAQQSFITTETPTQRTKARKTPRRRNKVNTPEQSI